MEACPFSAGAAGAAAAGAGAAFFESSLALSCAKVIGEAASIKQAMAISFFMQFSKMNLKTINYW